jgi:hypothetical protein
LTTSSDDHDVAGAVDRLQTLGSAVIDSSSVIYATKAGFWDLLRRTVSLTTVRGVRDEVGRSLQGVEVVESAGPSEQPAASRLSSREPVDEHVVRLAVALGVPVVSDDRGVLAMADSLGIDFYNSLMMLELLLLQGALTLDQYAEYRHALLSIAHYSRYVVSFGEQVHWEARKRIG